jgi:peroxiredoxin
VSVLGTAKRKQDANAPGDASDLADAVLHDHAGNEVRLGETWRERPAAVVWLRHFGCTFCRQHALQLQRDLDEFDEAGVNLVVIGHGTPEQAGDFRRKQKVEGLRLLVDPERETYELAGAKRASVGELLGPRVMARGLRNSLKHRVHQGKVVGHPAQLGGVLIVTPGNTVAWDHLSADASDVPPNDEVLEAARKAAGKG